MRTFEIVDSLKPDAKPCAVLYCDQARQRMRAVIADWAGPNDVPLAFAPFAARGEREVPEKWTEPVMS